MSDFITDYVSNLLGFLVLKLFFLSDNALSSSAHSHKQAELVQTRHAKTASASASPGTDGGEKNSKCHLNTSSLFTSKLSPVENTVNASLLSCLGVRWRFPVASRQVNLIGKVPVPSEKLFLSVLRRREENTG